MSTARSNRTALPVTMADVARHAKVSRATVSRVLSGSAPVSPKAEAAVKRSVRELGYIANTAAQQLARRDAVSIGALVRDPRNPIYGELHYELQAAAEALNLDLVITSPSTGGPDMEGRGLARLMGTRPAGLLVATGSAPLELLAPIAERIPLVILPRPIDNPAFSAVSFDELANARLMAEAVIGHGHRHVSVVRPDREISVVEHLRATTMMSILRAAGVTVEEVHRATPVYIREEPSYLGHLADGRSTAILFPNDLQAATFIAYLSGRGLRAGEDVSVTGMDGTEPWASALGLATVSVPTRKVAGMAINLLRDLIEGGPSESARIKVEGQLQLGSTLRKLT